MAPTFGEIDMSLSFRITRSRLLRYPAWFRPSIATPPVRPPSPTIATTSLFSERRSRAIAIPSAAEIAVDAWAAPKMSYSDSERFVKPDRPPAWERRRRAGGAEDVVLGFGGIREARQAAGLADRLQAVAPAREHLVRICLVAHVPHEEVVRGVEHVVQSHRQLQRAEARGEVPSRLGNRVDHERARL